MTITSLKIIISETTAAGGSKASNCMRRPKFFHHRAYSINERQKKKYTINKPEEYKVKWKSQTKEKIVIIIKISFKE